MLRKTVDQLITDVVALNQTPNSQATFDNNQIARLMDEEMRTAVIPLITRLREEYFVNTLSIPVDNTTVRFTIPPQAAGFRIRDIYLYNQSGNFQAKLNRINPDDIPYMLGGYCGLRNPTYYIENNDVVFYPALTSSYTCKVRYFKAPNHLYPVAQVQGQVLAKLGSNQVQMDNVPAGTTAVQDWNIYTGVNAATLDIVTPQSPYNFRLSTTTGLALIAQPIVAISGTVVTLTAEAYNSLQVGDFLCTNDTCGFIQFLPFEAYQLVKYRAAIRILNAQADFQSLAVMAQLSNAAMDDVASLMAPKVENMPKKIRPGATIGRAGRGRW